MSGRAKKGAIIGDGNYRYLASDLKGRKVKDVRLFHQHGTPRVEFEFTGGLTLRIDRDHVFDHEGWLLDYEDLGG